MTDEQIIKALECCCGTAHDSCRGCPYDDIGCEDKLEKDVLDLIKRLKSQNKEFDEKIVIQLGTIDWQAKEINRQKAEIERYKKTVGKLATKDGKVVGILKGKETEFIEKEVAETFKTMAVNRAKSEAISEYKEKVKAILMDKGIYPVVVKNALNEAEKEMVGENDV